jgi:hypothetical protein
MTNDKSSMTNSQFRLSPLVAACRAEPWRLCAEGSSLSVKSMKSVVQFLWLRLAALGLLRIFAAIIPKCLSMNNLQIKWGFSNQGQSRLIKANQVIFEGLTGVSTTNRMGVPLQTAIRRTMGQGGIRAGRAGHFPLRLGHAES